MNSSGADPAQEIVTVVDAENRPVAELPRRRVRSENLPHRATYIFVFDRLGRLLVQRRTATKDLYPSQYDLAAGGVVGAGESYEECAVREAEEELGIRGTALNPRLDLHYEDDRNRCFGRVFTCVHDGPFTLQPEEVESVAFHPVDEVLAGAVAPVTPDTLLALQRLLALDSGNGGGRRRTRGGSAHGGAGTGGPETNAAPPGALRGVACPRAGGPRP